MNQIRHDYPFEFSPKLIKFLGEELIHDKKIAIAELIKNTYDADATEVLLTIKDDEITIKDDGCGMSEDTIREYWLKVGNSSKSSSPSRTPKFKRLPIGEKGIGRLGVHKLGDHIQVVSKTENDKEIFFEIDWKRFEATVALKDLEPVTVVTRENPQVFTGEGQTGTKLVITTLKQRFEKKDINNLYSDLIKLNPPFSRLSNFKITFKFQDDLFENKELLSVDDIVSKALFHYKVISYKGNITDFSYQFRSPNENKIPSRQLILEDSNIQETIRNLKEKRHESNPDVDVGKVMFEGYIFDEKFSKLFQKPYEKITKEYLKDNGGIRVYRDGMRVYNYGEGGKDNDILDLDRKRAKRLGDNIGYNQLLASIELDREGSKNLIEKTNREGFIHNEAFLSLQQQLDFCMEVVMHCRKIDRANMEPLVGKEYDKGDIDTRIKKITSQVDKLDIEQAEKTSLKNSLYEFSEEFKQLKNIFLTASNSGLNLTFIIHEVDKIIDHLEEKIKARNLVQIERVFTHLKNSIDAYRDVIRLDKKTHSLSIDSLIKQVLFNTEYRLNSHGIQCIQKIAPGLKIIGKQGLIIGVFTNLFDNAIYWLEYYKVKPKKILIHAYAEDEYVVLLVADNGRGFNIGFDAALRPFISGRPDDSSMGIGLHLAQQVVIAHEGSIAHGDWQEEKLSEEFANGAIIKLKFRKG